ncbi:MAG: hypothetical protein LUH04_12310, partial [Clostridium sp.]|nr:hypothetical protein [Clostridium sp.]
NLCGHLYLVDCNRGDCQHVPKKGYGRFLFDIEPDFRGADGSIWYFDRYQGLSAWLKRLESNGIIARFFQSCTCRYVPGFP